MLRAALLRLSQETHLRDLTVHFGPARRVARRFVAGETLEGAIRVVQALNRVGILATLDHLGENVTNEGETRRATSEYIGLLQEIARQRVKSTISVKLTHLGLPLDRELCYQNLRSVVEEANKHGSIVEIDMEGSDYTAPTLDLYRHLQRDFDNLLVCIQAYLYRSRGDLLALLPLGPRIRLCKGAYHEPADIAFPSKSDVDENYRQLLTILWSAEGQRHGAYAAVATHDQRIISWTMDHAPEYGMAKDAFEYQMLYGIRRDLVDRLNRDGYRVRVYVPYGIQWYPYFMRRLAERPANFFFLLRHLFRG